MYLFRQGHHLPAKGIATINRFYHHCDLTIDAYSTGFQYGTKSFVEHVHKNHRQVVDKSKW